MPVPNTFANATATIPLSQLDANFATTITLGNTAIQLGNTVSTLNNMTLANVTVTSGNVTLTNVTVTTANATNAIIGTANVTTANIATQVVTTSQTLSYGTANGVLYLNGSKVATSGSAITFDGTNFATTGSVTSAGASNSGNLTFTGTGNRITGDFSNATVANRVMFQTSTTNGNTIVSALPNGTATTSAVRAYNNSDLANNSNLIMSIDGTLASIQSQIVGTGTYLPMTFYTGGSERMRVDTSGNVGIGTSSPSKQLMVYTASNSLQIQSVVRNANTGTGVAAIGFNVADTSEGDYTQAGIGLVRGVANGSGSLAFYNKGSGTASNFTTADEKMRIDTSGNLLVNTASQQSGGTLSVVATSGNCAATFKCADNGVNVVRSWMATTSGTRYHIAFGDGSSFTERGVISTNGSTTTYGTGSDYRLKENVQTMSGALARVAQMRPVTWTWKESQVSGEGFIAHELQAVVPDAVVGEKDAVDENGNPIYQNVDASFVVATLTAAIQEQQQMIETLQAKVAALEGKK